MHCASKVIALSYSLRYPKVTSSEKVHIASCVCRSHLHNLSLV